MDRVALTEILNQLSIEFNGRVSGKQRSEMVELMTFSQDTIDRVLQQSKMEKISLSNVMHAVIDIILYRTQESIEKVIKESFASLSIDDQIAMREAIKMHLNSLTNGPNVVSSKQSKQLADENSTLLEALKETQSAASSNPPPEDIASTEDKKIAEIQACAEALQKLLYPSHLKMRNLGAENYR
jgi:hypothetical protein